MLLLFLLVLPLLADGLLLRHQKHSLLFSDQNSGDKLILTPYIESGRIEEARKLSEVRPLLPQLENMKSYSGFLTVDKECDSNLFFWFFPAVRDMESAPVLVWLQGGPGASSLYGLFQENGPYSLDVGNDLAVRPFSWHHIGSCIYIDNPVGTGFSYARNSDCYSKNETEVGRNLLSAVKQIMKLFPEISSNPFFITGESYAGKYVPALAYAIHTDNSVNSVKLNLQGLAIGNGLVDPINQFCYSDYLYQLGLIDTHGKEVFATVEEYCRKCISEERWTDAFNCFDVLLNGDRMENKTSTYFFNETSFTFYFNFLYSSQPPEGQIDELVKSPHIRKAIHVGNSRWHSGKLVLQKLQEDVPKSVAPWLEELLEHYRVLVYNGQLDIIVAYPLTVSYVKKLNWSGAEEYKTAARHTWMVDGELAGYAKTARRLTEVLVRNAGHMVPADQPKWAMDLVSRFVHDKPFF